MSRQRKSQKNSKNSNVNRLLVSIRRHWTTALIAGIFAFAAGVQATSWLIGVVIEGWNENLGWQAAEQDKINKLGPSVQVGYIKDVLGEPIFRDGGEKYKEYIFQRKFGYVQVVADKNDKTVLYSVVVCKDNFNPTLVLPDQSEVKLKDDSLKSRGNGVTYYSISGATANSYLVEGGYLGNPSNYQEFYVGATDSCGSLNTISDAYDVLEIKKCLNIHLGLQGSKEQFCQYNTDDPLIDNLRTETKINTVVITAPHVSLGDLSPYVQFGPSRIELRVLPSYYNDWK